MKSIFSAVANGLQSVKREKRIKFQLISSAVSFDELQKDLEGSYS
jgi:hypothetical protein